MVPADSPAFANFEAGNVYYFNSDQITNSSEPHFFVVVSNSNDEIIVFVCCTSKFEKRRRFIELAGLPFSTLVWLKKDNNNGLKQDSYVDCNNVFRYTKSEIIKLHELGTIRFSGKVKESGLVQLKQGVTDSPLIAGEIKALV